MKKICVIGSLNIDMSTKMAVFPHPGETVKADAFGLHTGGKGANQAVAAARLGADVRLVGLLGELFHGGEYIGVLDANNVKRDTVDVLDGSYPGIAFIAVDNSGRNTIYVYPGANAMVTPYVIDSHWDKISRCDIFLLQQEIPAEANLHAMRRIKSLPGKTIILDPAPADGFTPECLLYADIITPNETEMAIISATELKCEDHFKQACDKLHAKGARTVIAKAGEHGAYLSCAGSFEHLPGFRVQAVDTTAAGDSFNAGLAYGLALGLDMRGSVTLGHAVASISTTRFGAQAAMPDAKTLTRFLRENNVQLTLPSDNG